MDINYNLIKGAKMQMKMGELYYGVNLNSETPQEAVYSGVLMQMTITAQGRLTLVLQKSPDEISKQFDSGLVFATETEAIAFWELYNQEYKTINKTAENAVNNANLAKLKILGEAKFVHLVKQ